MSDPSQVFVVGPLTPFATGFARALAQQGYTPHSATAQLRLMAHLSRWLVEQGLETREIGTIDVERFLRARRRAGYAQYLTSKAMRPLLEYLGAHGVSLRPPPAVVPGPVEGILARYRRYLTDERGLRYSTARLYAETVRPFVGRRVAPDGQTLAWEDLTAADITAFVVARTPTQSRGAAKMTVTALRSLLRFLHIDGTIPRPLTAAVPAVAGWRLAGLPKGLTPAEVQALFAACDRRTRMGRRAFAVLTTLVRLGLRAGELAALRLHDIDWRAGTIVIRGKGHQVEPLPLPADVGDALGTYLRRARPATALDRTVFVRVRAPHRALSAGGVTQIVFAAARRAGLAPIHAHRLRHTAATEMLRAGASLPEIGQVLRHRRALTTAIYAKVDHAALRTIARPWPGGVA